MKAPKQTPNYINTRSFKNYRAEQFSIDIAHIPWDTVDLMESVDGKLDAFNDLFLTCLDNHAPIKTVKLKCLQNPSITSEIEKLVKTWNRLHRRARKSGSEEDWQAFMTSTTEYKMKRKAIRQAERKYYNKQVMVNKDNSGSMWKTKLRALPSKPTRVLNTPKTQGHWRTNLIAFLFL